MLHSHYEVKSFSLRIRCFRLRLIWTNSPLRGWAIVGIPQTSILNQNTQLPFRFQAWVLFVCSVIMEMSTQFGVNCWNWWMGLYRVGYWVSNTGEGGVMFKSPKIYTFSSQQKLVSFWPCRGAPKKFSFL